MTTEIIMLKQNGHQDIQYYTCSCFGTNLECHLQSSSLCALQYTVHTHHRGTSVYVMVVWGGGSLTFFLTGVDLQHDSQKPLLLPTPPLLPLCPPLVQGHGVSLSDQCLHHPQSWNLYTAEWVGASVTVHVATCTYIPTYHSRLLSS